MAENKTPQQTPKPNASNKPNTPEVSKPVTAEAVKTETATKPDAAPDATPVSTPEPTKGPTAEEKSQQWNELPKKVQAVFETLNKRIDEHNKNVALIKAATGDESKKLLFELRDQNPANNEEIDTYLAEIEKLDARREAIIAKANKKAEEVYADQLKMPSEEDVKKAREEVSKSGVELRAKVKGMADFSEMFGEELGHFIKDVSTLKGTGTKSSTSTGEIWRPRTKAIYVNGVLIQENVKNNKGVFEPKSTLNILASWLNEKTKTKAFSTVALQQAYLKAAGGDKDNIPETVEFELEHQLGDTTVKFPIKIEK